MWTSLLSLAPGGVATTRVLDELGFRPANTAQGIFRDQDNTSGLAAEGITLTLLVSGTYADAFDDDAGEYHYPATNRGYSRDENEIKATKNAKLLGLPLFVVLRGPSAATRVVRRGWIEDWDDSRRVFLVAFREPATGVQSIVDREPFVLSLGRRSRRSATVAVREGQARFRYSVLGRCEGMCVACGLQVDVLLDAAHVCGVEHGGTDDPRNGIALCRNHHRAFDYATPLFGIDPDTRRLVPKSGYSLGELRISCHVLSPKHAPHEDALRWAWGNFKTRGR